MKKLKKILQSKKILLIILLITLASSIIFTKYIKLDSRYKEETTFIGTIEEYSIDGDKFSFIIKTVEKELVKCNYYFKNIEEKQSFENIIGYGYTIKINGDISIPKQNTIPNTFNYKKYLYNKKIYRIINVKSISFKKEPGMLNQMRNKMIKYIKNQENSDYLLAFIIGNKNYIDEETFNNYRNNGVTHLFAISGMHISLFALILRKLLEKISVKSYKKDIIVVSFLIFYAFITGFPASIKRAFLIYILSIINTNTKLEIPTINLLYITIIILIITNPFIIYDIGFIYSAVTCFSLIWTSGITKSKHKILSLLKTSVIAFLFSTPITLYYFYEINLFSIINNIIFIPWITFIVYPFSLITSIIPLLSPIYSFLINITEFVNEFSKSYLSLIINIPFSYFDLVIYYFILVIGIKINKKYFLFLLIEIILITTISKFDTKKYIYYLDVGQGDSAIIITPHRKEVIMIDTGGKISYPKDSWQKQRTTYHLSDTTMTFLKSLGINKLDYLLLTHGDYDHMGEAINLVNNFKVEKVIFNCGTYNDLEKELIKVLDKKKIPYYSCIKELNIDNNKLYFLNNKDYGNENDNSSVIYTKLNNHKFLFMGDAGVEVEENLIKKYNLTNIDVLKVGHHGSKTSSSKEFIDEITPKYSIISVGKNNRYGHPNSNVLDNLDDSKIYRTDQHGSIMFKIKNNKLKIETCAP